MITIILVSITALISIGCFYNNFWFDKWQFNPYQIYHRKQWYRLLTHGFLHADWIHLIINMIVLFSFGQGVEAYLGMLDQDGVLRFHPTFYYLFFYLSAIIISSLTTLKKHRDDIYYNAVGASGAVSGGIFFCIFFNPWHKLHFYGIIPVPGIIFGLIYIWYSHYMSRKPGHDNINHDAHLIGAIYGLTFPILLDARLFYVFIKKLIDFSF
jgi:membrane associated rhomboid family serine protease